MRPTQAAALAVEGGRECFTQGWTRSLQASIHFSYVRDTQVDAFFFFSSDCLCCLVPIIRRKVLTVV